MTRRRTYVGDCLYDPYPGPNPAWVRRVYEVICDLARRMPRLASDDVWAELDRQPNLPWTPDHRAFAAAVKMAEANAIIIVTSQTRPTRRARAHRRPIYVWASTSLDDPPRRPA